ncbi:MAG: fused DSP-PTPase phosphatase/NAD kinase-like protein [Bryobacteraceae bacterium]
MRFFLLRLVLLLCVVEIGWTQSKPLHVRNFAEVNEHLYRGGAPTNIGLKELAAMHVSMIIDLREPGEGTDFEKHAVAALGMQYVNIPLRPFSAPSQEQIDQVLSLLLHKDSERIFLHCRRGKDRTGTVIACYRMQHDGWDKRAAILEARKHGMSFTERGMRSFILDFTPAGPSALAKATK